jgi:magnesium-transporting ATPase (P-type)
MYRPPCPADRQTVPPDFDEQLGQYTRQGLRVLALASRRLGMGVTEAQAQARRRDLI